MSEREALLKKISAAMADGKDSGGYDTLFDMLAHIALKVIDEHRASPAATEAWWKTLADNWRGRNGNSTTGDSVRNSCADELEKVANRHAIGAAATPTRDLLMRLRDYLDINARPGNDLAPKISQEITAALAGKRCDCLMCLAEGDNSPHRRRLSTVSRPHQLPQK